MTVFYEVHANVITDRVSVLLIWLCYICLSLHVSDYLADLSEPAWGKMLQCGGQCSM